MRIFPLLLIAAAATAQPKVAQHMILFEPTGTDLNVSETIIVDGSGKGTIQAYIPSEANTPQARNAQVTKTAKPGVFDVSFDAQGQETRIDLAWSMPFVLPETISGRVLHSEGAVRMVFPKGVTATGPMLESNGTEPTTQATIYTLKGTTYKIDINGAGSLRAQQPAEQPPPSEGSDEGQSLDIILPRIYDKLYWILGLTLGILAIGFFLNFKASVKR